MSQKGTELGVLSLNTNRKSYMRSPSTQLFEQTWNLRQNFNYGIWQVYWPQTGSHTRGVQAHHKFEIHVPWKVKFSHLCFNMFKHLSQKGVKSWHMSLLMCNMCKGRPGKDATWGVHLHNQRSCKTLAALAGNVIWRIGQYFKLFCLLSTRQYHIHRVDIKLTLTSTHFENISCSVWKFICGSEATVHRGKLQAVFMGTFLV